MSDAAPSAPATPTTAPAPVADSPASPSAAPASLFGAPQESAGTAPLGIVRGTAVMSGWMEKSLNEAEADRQERLRESDEDQAKIRKAKTSEDLNEYGMEHTADMGRPGQSAVVILAIPYPGDRVQYCQCDLTETEGAHGSSVTLNLICPDCHLSGVKQAWCQIKVDDRNKKMTLDYRTKGKVWVDPDNGQAHLVAGNVDVSETFRCGRPGCGFRARIAGDGPGWEDGVSRLIRE